MNRISMENLKELVSEASSDGFNLFLGAGISRDPPTCGPIWSEIQIGFLNAVFDRIADENWPAAQDFIEERERLHEFNVRPEIFWREMIGLVDEKIIWNSLNAAGVGAPNYNHACISELLGKGCCKWAITTNFDEHIEKLLPGNVHVSVPTSSIELPKEDSSIYVKLHGSIHSGQSLSYTLEHYDDLIERNKYLLKNIIPGRLLIIAGYSGYDSDVLPVLLDLIDNVPSLVVIKHPGSSEDQPVFRLTTKQSDSYIVESTCQEVLHAVGEELELEFSNISPRSSEQTEPDFYQEAIGELGMHLCPLILSTAFRLDGAWGLARKYAWLTHDAVTDDRYRPSISESEYQQIHQDLALSLKLAGDATGAEIMLSQAKSSVNENTDLSGFMRQISAESITKNAPSQQGDNSTISHTSFNNFKPSEILTAQLELQKRLGSPSKKNIFLACWGIGLARRREGAPGRAIEAFNEVEEFVTNEAVSHLERCRFLLDFGAAVYEHGAELKDDELARQSHFILQICVACTQESRDWGTNARAHRLLATLFTYGGGFTEAWEHINLARKAVNQTKDTALKERIELSARQLDDLQNHLDPKSA